MARNSTPRHGRYSRPFYRPGKPFRILQVPIDRFNQAIGTPKARLVFIHGFSDHINAYGILFPTLATLGISTYGFDQRGWGRSVHSPSEKGLTGPTSLV